MNGYFQLPPIFMCSATISGPLVYKYTSHFSYPSLRILVWVSSMKDKPIHFLLNKIEHVWAFYLLMSTMYLQPNNIRPFLYHIFPFKNNQQ